MLYAIVVHLKTRCIKLYMGLLQYALSVFIIAKKNKFYLKTK